MIVVGIAAALAAPIGDLAESQIKRDLGIGTVGTILPGHGGLLDRFDGLLFVLPTVCSPPTPSCSAEPTMTSSVSVLGSTGSIGANPRHRGPGDYVVAALGVGRNPDVIMGVSPRGRRGCRCRGRGRDRDALPKASICWWAMRRWPTLHSPHAISGVVASPSCPSPSRPQGGQAARPANKESLIAAGPVVQRAWQTPGAELVPVDGEHCAVPPVSAASGVTGKVGNRSSSSHVLTASGGPFRGRAALDLEQVTIDDALAHPTWSMDPRSRSMSTLMNKVSR